jgi:hypothetical protein
MFRSPGAQRAQRFDQFFACACERVGDLRRRGVLDPALYDPVRFQLAELSGQNLLANAREKLAKFSETFGAEAQMPDRQDFPFAANDVDGPLHRATKVIFHRDLRGLPNCAYFRRARDGYTILGNWPGGK